MNESNGRREYVGYTCRTCGGKHVLHDEKVGPLQRLIRLSTPSVSILVGYADGPRARYVANLILFFLYNGWCFIPSFVPDLLNIDKKCIAIRYHKQISHHLLNARALACFWERAIDVNARIFDADGSTIFIADIAEELSGYDERAHVFVMANTIAHELLHIFYEDEELIESKLESFRSAVGKWVSSERFLNDWKDWCRYPLSVQGCEGVGIGNED